MNFQQLEYVLAVHTHKHFGLAAENCHITQATLSAMIKKLEEELGFLIFDRSRKPVKTTEQGLELIGLAKSILTQKEKLYHINTNNHALEGNLTLGIIPTIANSLLPLILPLILQENPKLKLTVLEITTEEIKQQLAMDKIDLGILATPIQDKQFEEHILYYEPMMVYGIQEDDKEYVTSRDIKDDTIWLLEEGHCFRNQAITICEIREKEDEENNLTFKGSSFETLLNLTNTFGGYTLIPELYYTRMSEAEKKRTKPFKKPIPVREISILSYHAHAHAKTIALLTPLIQKAIEGVLSTKQYQNKDLDIIGI